VPTADQRALVENAAAFGITQADIDEQLKIDEKTLRTSRSAFFAGLWAFTLVICRTIPHLCSRIPFGNKGQFRQTRKAIPADAK
jgi:hypothetical protein